MNTKEIKNLVEVITALDHRLNDGVQLKIYKVGGFYFIGYDIYGRTVLKINLSSDDMASEIKIFNTLEKEDIIAIFNSIV